MGCQAWANKHKPDLRCQEKRTCINSTNEYENEMTGSSEYIWKPGWMMRAISENSRFQSHQMVCTTKYLDQSRYGDAEVGILAG